MTGRGGGRCWKLAACVLSFTFPLIAQAEVIDEARACASAHFRDRIAVVAPTGADIDALLRSALWIKRVEDPKLEGMPFQLYEVQYTLVRPSLTAHLLVDGDRCQLVAGDVSELLDREMDWEEKRRFAIESLNSILENRAVPAGEQELLRYAEAAALVIYIDDQIQILEDLDSLRDVVEETKIGEDPGDDVATRVKKALEAYTVPRVQNEPGLSIVVFNSWTKLGGALRRHQISVLPGGTIDERSDILVREVGPYSRVRYRM
jgi:hypothetical protein